MQEEISWSGGKECRKEVGCRKWYDECAELKGLIGIRNKHGRNLDESPRKDVEMVWACGDKIG